MPSRISLSVALMALLVLLLQVPASSADPPPKDLLIISCSDAPPPGYQIEKSFGEFFVTQEVLSLNAFRFKAALDSAISAAGKRAADAIKALGGNAILGETIQITVTSAGADLNAYILITGDGVILKPRP